MRLMLLISVVFGVLSACASAPVQEMSDARQALQAASAVGAHIKAPGYYSMAEGHIESAESALQKGHYSEAREQAEHAKKYALKARLKALESNP